MSLVSDQTTDSCALVSRRGFFGVGAVGLIGVLVGRAVPGPTVRRRYVPGSPIAAPSTDRRPVRGLPAPRVLDADGAWRAAPVGFAPSPSWLRAAFRSTVRSPGRVLHVAGTGNDRNPGTAASPLRQISAAVAQARAGDQILVSSGTYGYTEVRNFSGRPDAWLSIMTADDSVQATITVPPPTDNFVNIIASSFVGIYGFEICGDQTNRNPNGSGISVYGNSHHIAIWNNHVHDFPGGGVNCFDVEGSHDLIDISYNLIHATSKYSPSNTSGISVYAGRDLTAGATLPGGYGYRIVNNYIYDVECLVPFTAGGYNVPTDGNGVSLDCLASTYNYRKPVLVAGNVITGCGGRAVLAYNSVNIDVEDNTGIGNLRSASPLIRGGVEFEGKTDSSVRHLRNVILPMHTTNTTDLRSFYQGNVVLGGTQDVPSANFDRRTVGDSYFRVPTAVGLADSGTAPTAFAAAG